jgi:fibrillarin-like rRNA methylase
MMTTDKDKQKYFRRKITVALLGESSLMTPNRVSELCKKFFEYGIEYANKNTKKS